MISTLVLVIGTFFLASEAIGQGRITILEGYLKKVTTLGKNAFGEVIVEILPLKKQEEKSKNTVNPIDWILDWIFNGFLLISILSWFVFFYLINKYGEIQTLYAIISCWISFIVFELLSNRTKTYFLSLWSKQKRFWVVIKLIPISIFYLAFIVIKAVTFLGTLLTSFPASLIFLVYIVIFLMCWLINNFIRWKEKHNLGNIFVILGLAITILGIFLQHFKY